MPWSGPKWGGSRGSILSQDNHLTGTLREELYTTGAYCDDVSTLACVQCSGIPSWPRWFPFDG